MGPTIDMLLFAGRMKTWAIANMFLLRFRYPSLANDTFAQCRLRLSELYCYSRSGKKPHFLFCCCRTKEFPSVCFVHCFEFLEVRSLLLSLCVQRYIENQLDLDSLLLPRLLIVDTFPNQRLASQPNLQLNRKRRPRG